MGKGAPLRWIENRCLGRHLHGGGIEIGALWCRFPVPQLRFADHVKDDLPPWPVVFVGLATSGSGV